LDWGEADESKGEAREDVEATAEGAGDGAGPGEGEGEEAEGNIQAWDERNGWTGSAAEADIVLDTASRDAEARGGSSAAQTEKRPRPSFIGQTMVLGVGKRIQDRKHSIWLPQVHDPHSFRTPNDQAPDGGSRFDALQAPRGWTAPAKAAPSVNQDESCNVM